MNKLSGYIGRKTIISVNHFFNLSAVVYRFFTLVLSKPEQGRKVVRRATVEQIYFTGVQALPAIIPISLLIGSMLIFQFAQLSGQYNLEKVIIILIIRELGPVITALVVILRSASAVTIEISYMNILNELEAIEMAGIDPMRIIFLPRLIGITSAMLCLFIIFDLVSILGGYIIIWTITYLPMGNFPVKIAQAISVSDIAVGIVKAILFGMTVTTVALYHGIGIKRQFTQLPQVTSRALIECFFYCLVINIFISAVFYL